MASVNFNGVKLLPPTFAVIFGPTLLYVIITITDFVKNATKRIRNNLNGPADDLPPICLNKNF